MWSSLYSTDILLVFTIQHWIFLINYRQWRLQKVCEAENGRPTENGRGVQHLYKLTNNYNGPQAKKGWPPRPRWCRHSHWRRWRTKHKSVNRTLNWKQLCDVIWQLSDYPMLIIGLNKILVYLLVTSCSAERVISRIRIPHCEKIYWDQPWLMTGLHFWEY